MRNRFDQLGKKVGKGALEPSGVTVIEDEISRDAQHADLRHDPDPSRDAERARLGLLGRIASVACLIELYGHPPSAAEVRACIGKYIAFWEQRAAAAKKRGRSRKSRAKGAPFVEPFLWILAAGRPAGVLSALKATRRRGWTKGVYGFGGDVLHVGLVVASELPRTRSTLLVRLMTGGPLLAGAIEELGRLPPDAVERAVAEPDLLRLQHVLGTKPTLTPEEEEFVVTMQTSWEEARKLGRAEAVLTVLRARGIAVPDAARERILAQKDEKRLKRWLERAIVASSVAEVIDAPRRR